MDIQHKEFWLDENNGLKWPLTPKQAFATVETKPLAVFVGDHRQLLSERENLQVEYGPVSEQSHKGGEQGKEDVFHSLDATARDQEKSAESISIRFLVGTLQVWIDGTSLSSNAELPNFP